MWMRAVSFLFYITSHLFFSNDYEHEPQQREHDGGAQWHDQSASGVYTQGLRDGLSPLASGAHASPCKRARRMKGDHDDNGGSPTRVPVELQRPSAT